MRIKVSIKTIDPITLKSMRILAKLVMNGAITFFFNHNHK